MVAATTLRENLAQGVCQTCMGEYVGRHFSAKGHTLLAIAYSFLRVIMGST